MCRVNHKAASTRAISQQEKASRPFKAKAKSSSGRVVELKKALCSTIKDIPVKAIVRKGINAFTVKALTFMAENYLFMCSVAYKALGYDDPAFNKFYQAGIENCKYHAQAAKLENLGKQPASLNKTVNSIADEGFFYGAPTLANGITMGMSNMSHGVTEVVHNATTDAKPEELFASRLPTCSTSIN